ncbi:hypothetical protein LXL04_020528 [Taraxacum kok-saghyz]
MNRRFHPDSVDSQSRFEKNRFNFDFGAASIPTPDLMRYTKNRFNFDFFRFTFSYFTRGDIHAVAGSGCPSIDRKVESCQQVQAVISFLKPQVVFLELCSNRVAVYFFFLLFVGNPTRIGTGFVIKSVMDHYVKFFLFQNVPVCCVTKMPLIKHTVHIHTQSQTHKISDHKHINNVVEIKQPNSNGKVLRETFPLPNCYGLCYMLMVKSTNKKGNK